jgi:hypothetical protein
MNNAIRRLVLEAQNLHLAHVSIEGTTQRDGHGFLSRQGNVLTLTIFASNGTIVGLKENLRVKAETQSGEILIIEGRPHAITRGHYPRVEMHFDKLLGTNSGNDPASLQDKTIERITTRLSISDLIGANAKTIITEDRPEIEDYLSHEKTDCLVIEPDHFYVRQENGLEITCNLKPEEHRNVWLPITSAIAYIHGVPCWPYFTKLQGKNDATFELRNVLDLPRTKLRPIGNSTAMCHPTSLVQIAKSIAEMFSVHPASKKIHQILHNFVIGTAGDGVAGTLVAAAALEGLCRLLEGKIDGQRAPAKDIIKMAAGSLGLDLPPFSPALESWDRVRNTLAHGIFHRAYDVYPNPKKSRRLPGEDIIHDLSRIAGLFHAIILKAAKYRDFGRLQPEKVD